MINPNYAENVKVLPVLAPADIVANATATQYVALKNVAGLLEFQISFGNIASTDSTGGVQVTIEASSAGSSNASESAIAFGYRLSAAVGTDNLGAITAATSAGVQVTESDDNKALLVYIDPSVVTTASSQYTHVRAVLTPTAEVTATVVGATARFTPRYAGNSIPSSS
jgi:hypothetical protein